MDIRQLSPVLSLAVLGLTGCAGTPDSHLSTKTDGNGEPGLAIVGMTLSGKSMNKITSFDYGIRRITAHSNDDVVTVRRYSTSTQRVRRSSTGSEPSESAWRAVVTGPGLPDSIDILNSGQLIGRLLTLNLSVGDYEIYTWRIVESGYPGEIEHGPAQNFSYRFSIKPGQAAYLGRVHLSLSDENKQTISIDDQRDTDLSAVWQRYPATSLAPVEAQILQR